MSKPSEKSMGSSASESTILSAPSLKPSATHFTPRGETLERVEIVLDSPDQLKILTAAP